MHFLLYALLFAAAEGVRADQALPGVFVVTDFGAVGDGVADDTDAFTAALNRAAETGGVVYVPPVARGRGYVLTSTVSIPEGVTLLGAPAGVGSNARAVFPLPENFIVGAKILARPRADQYAGDRKAPLFRLSPGCTVRGFWILYDQQPMPSDAEFQDPSSPFYYPSFEDARKRFIRDHVKPYGPTFYGEHLVNVVIEDIVCDRAVDFIYLATAGKSHFQRLTSFGYGRAFAIEKALDVIHIHNYQWVPNTGPLSPGGPFQAVGGRSYTWVYGIIVSQPNTVGIHLGHVDGYSMSDITLFGLHTGIRFGYSEAYPLVNPVTGMPAPPLAPGFGPWGDISGLKIDQCVIGVHFVWPTHLTNRVANALVFTGYQDGSAFAAASGTGDLEGLTRQGAFVVEKSHSKENNTGFVSTFMAANTIVASFQDTARFGPAAADVRTANGRVFLLDGDLFMEMTGIQVNPPYDEHRLWAAGPHVGRTTVRLRGYIAGFNPQPDMTVEIP